MIATMHEAKTQLSKLVERALAGEEVIVTHGRSRTPIVKLVPVKASTLRERPIQRADRHRTRVLRAIARGRTCVVGTRCE